MLFLEGRPTKTSSSNPLCSRRNGSVKVGRQLRGQGSASEQERCRKAVLSPVADPRHPITRVLWVSRITSAVRNSDIMLASPCSRLFPLTCAHTHACRYARTCTSIRTRIHAVCTHTHVCTHIYNTHTHRPSLAPSATHCSYHGNG
jgi:hypothetical protein